MNLKNGNINFNNTINKRQKKVFALIALLLSSILVGVIFIPQAAAVSVTVSGLPSSLGQNETATVSIAVELLSADMIEIEHVEIDISGTVLKFQANGNAIAGAFDGSIASLSPDFTSYWDYNMYGYDYKYAYAYVPGYSVGSYDYVYGYVYGFAGPRTLTYTATLTGAYLATGAQTFKTSIVTSMQPYSHFISDESSFTVTASSGHIPTYYVPPVPIEFTQTYTGLTSSDGAVSALSNIVMADVSTALASIPDGIYFADYAVGTADITDVISTLAIPTYSYPESLKANQRVGTPSFIVNHISADIPAASTLSSDSLAQQIRKLSKVDAISSPIEKVENEVLVDFYTKLTSTQIDNARVTRVIVDPNQDTTDFILAVSMLNEKPYSADAPTDEFSGHTNAGYVKIFASGSSGGSSVDWTSTSSFDSSTTVYFEVDKDFISDNNLSKSQIQFILWNASYSLIIICYWKYCWF